MSFASISFLVFFAVFLGLWPLCKERNLSRWSLICIASFIFYGWWEWHFAVLLFLTGALNFLCARAIGVLPSLRRCFLAASIIGNMGVLLFFKYAVLARYTLRGFGWVEPDDWSFVDQIILPVGISFYTFQALSYTIDVYRGEIAPVRNLLHFWAYLSFFPQLVAGPIIRAKDLLPQLERPMARSSERMWAGLEQICLGFFKKLVVSDNLAPFVNASFQQDGGSLGGAIWWSASACFALQIYCDFSGYSDIACGLARWLGFDFPKNFNRPYWACGFRDFWSRWHITLSMWFRDYIYIPLGGSRFGRWRTGLSLVLTMLLSGLWHGANWTFLAWGTVHAFLLVAERITGWPERLSALPCGRTLARLVTFGLVVWAWVFFRAGDLNQAMDISGKMLTDPLGGWPGAIHALPVNAVMALFCFSLIAASTALQERWPALLSSAWVRFILVVSAIAVVVFLRGPGNEFIYFQF